VKSGRGPYLLANAWIFLGHGRREEERLALRAEVVKHLPDVFFKPQINQPIRLRLGTGTCSSLGSCASC